MPLTDIKIKSLKPEEKPYKVSDQYGLFLYVTPAGSKKWRLKYRFNKKENVYSIGDYPAVSLRDARAKTFEIKEMIVQGINPALERKKYTTTTGGTFKDVALEWVEKQKNKWSEDHKQTIVYRLERYIFIPLGAFPISEITAPQVLSILRIFEKQGKNDITRRLLSIISQVFRFGVACGLCDSDPCRDLRGALAYHKSIARAAITTPKEAGQLMRDIKAYRAGIVREAMLWSAYTFCRPVEVRRAEWSEIDFEKCLWVIPAEKMKMRREHKVPLSRQCMKILENQQGLDKKWIFPSVRKGKCLSEAGVLSAIRSMGYEKDQMCTHGFRAMASTLLNELWYRSDLIEISLAHGDENKVRAVYNRAESMEERRKMMQEWANYLDGLAEK